jgi:hypothetical protein
MGLYNERTFSIANVQFKGGQVMIATATSRASTLPMGGQSGSGEDDSPALHKVNGKSGSAGASPSRTASSSYASPGPGLVPAKGAKTRKRKPWKPGNRDYEIYVWVRFQGIGQAQVASQYEISQAIVSRTLQRYEKWQAHGQPGEDGTLNPAERMRAQRWLTYERNERILGSCLRMAGDMEFPKDAWKSVTRRPGLPTSGEQEIRTESSMLDRSGMAARFLRLAFKINMEQLKLTEKEPLEPLPPLTEEENAAYEAESAALWTEPDEAQRQREENEAIRHRIDSEVSAAVAAEVERRLRAAESTPEREEAADETRMDADGSEGCTDEEVPSDQTLLLKLHRVHNGMASESGTSAVTDKTYVSTDAKEKSSARGMNDEHRVGQERVASDAAKCTRVGESDAVADASGGALP